MPQPHPAGFQGWRTIALGCVLLFLAAPSTALAAQDDATPDAASAPSDAGPVDEGLESGDGPIPGRQVGSPFNVDYPHIRDDERVFRRSQREELSDDALRLNRHGIPTEIVVRENPATPAESRRYAAALRSEQNVESAEGRDDGLLILVTVDPEAARSTSVVFSYGQNTFPKGALDAASVQRIYEQTVAPRLEDGKLYDALRLGIRQMIYLETYFPDPQPPRTGTQDAIASVLMWLSPIAIMAHAVLFAMLWFNLPIGHARWRPTPRAIVSTAAITVALLIPLAVYAQSALGIAAALLIAVLMAFHLLLPPVTVPPVRTVTAGARPREAIAAIRRPTAVTSRRRWARP